MKKTRFLLFVLTIATLVLSACGAAATPATTVGSGKVEAMPVTFIGIIDSIAGDQWLISGTTITVDSAVVRDGPFNVGDQVKVEGVVNPDGSFTVSRVEVPTPQDVATATLPPFGDTNTNDANGNANINDGNINDDNSNGLNSNDDNSNDDNSNGLNSNDDDMDDDNGNGSNSNSDDSSNDNSSGNGSKSDDDDDSGGNSNDD